MWRCKRTSGEFPRRPSQCGTACHRATWNWCSNHWYAAASLTASAVQHGGYELAREPHSVTIQDILRAASNAFEAEEEPNSELVAKVVLPVLSVAEREFGQALSRISLDDMVQRAVLDGQENKNSDRL